RLALSQQVVPAAVCQAPALAGYDAHAQLWLEPALVLPDSVRVSLRLLGVQLDATGDVALHERVGSWYQLLDLQPQAECTVADDTPVLFELTDYRLWPRLLKEVRRLHRNGRHTACTWRETEDGRLLVRVVGPPYFSLLRALEAGNEPRSLVAYVEQGPRIWVEAGWRHPLLQHTPPPGKLLLIRRPRSWSLVEDGVEQTGLTEAALPPVTATAPEVLPVRRWLLPLRMGAGGPTDGAEFWVLREQPFRQLAELLQHSDDGRLARLAVALVEYQGQAVILLRVRPGRQEPPVLLLDAESYRPYLKLSNVLLPVGQRLKPALRRDAVRELLEARPGRINWLRPSGDGAFSVESIHEAAFLPLLKLVDYISECAPQELLPWKQGNCFEFENYTVRHEDLPDDWREHFQLPDGGAATAPWLAPLADWLKAQWSRFPAWLSAPPSTVAAPAPAEAAKPVERTPPPRPLPAPAPSAEPSIASRLEQHVASSNHSLEDRFVSVPGPLDALERRTLWPKLASLYQSEGRLADAALCWINALWLERDPSPLWGWNWFRSEARAARWVEPTTDVPRVLADARPDLTDVRALAAFSHWAAQQRPPSPVLLQQLEPICRCLEKQEALLPVRGAWLAWSSLARISGGDVLSLARARDRLLERLLGKGLSLDQDLPAFLRVAGQSGGVRTDSIMDWLLKQREPIRHWIRGLHDQLPPDRSRQARYVLSTERMLGMQPPYGPIGEAYCTAAYADLILAWGLARLGAERDSCQLVKQARTVLTSRDAVHRFLLEAYSHRIQQVLEGRSAEGPLPDHLLLQLRDLNDLDRYKIAWLRQRSRILEPCEQVDPFQGDVQRQYFDDLNPLLARLGEVRDRNELAARIQQLLELAASGSHRAALPRVLRAALAQAPRVGEPFALALLDRVGRELETLGDSAEEMPLLEKALVVAAHFEQTAQVQHLLAALQQLLDRLDRREGARAFAALAESSFRDLRKLGMRDEVDRL
ncbi:MAG: hypothetical protein JNM56_29915, partial [Planctomycetia bacterium]|nr:hypothetical protein [Planctomycetia bacterium]